MSLLSSFLLLSLLMPVLLPNPVLSSMTCDDCESISACPVPVVVEVVVVDDDVVVEGSCCCCCCWDEDEVDDFNCCCCPLWSGTKRYFSIAMLCCVVVCLEYSLFYQQIGW